MCGIHGILALDNTFQCRSDWIGRMGSVTTHRGPDDAGVHIGAGIALGMRRLSIIDLESGQQPIANEDETVWVVCNGEIYNFRELRHRLRKQGHSFRSASDVEVIVHLYEEYGDAFVDHLNGMYGIALWDSTRKRLLLVRDRLGIKPVYYQCDHRRLAFASEAKSILSLPDVEAELDPSALGKYLSLGYVPTPHSIFRGIRKLPPASVMVCENGRTSIRRYWSFTPSEKILSEEEWIERLLEQLNRSVTSQMVSDVPLGAFLSGGIDSSTVVAFMAGKSAGPVRTYAIGFEGDAAGAFYNELPHARRVAELFGTEHKEILVRPDVVSLLPRLIWHLDEPLADSAFVTTFLVSEFARRDVKVILSGVGGDELFGGYRRYLGTYYDRYLDRLPGWLLRDVLVPIAERLPSDRHSRWKNRSRQARSYLLASRLSPAERYNAYVNVFSDQLIEELLIREPDEGDDIVQEAHSGAYSPDPLTRVMALDLATQLPDDLLQLTDRMSMAASLECRVPLLDHELVELAGAMPSRLKVRGRELKWILKRALRRHLPDEILFREKRGFGAPVGAWFKAALEPVLLQTLSRETIERRGLFNWPAVQRTIDLHRRGREDHTDHLLSLLNLEIWARIYLDGVPFQSLSAELEEAVSA